MKMFDDGSAIDDDTNNKNVAKVCSGRSHLGKQTIVILGLMELTTATGPTNKNFSFTILSFKYST